jgi:hypothetical protein
VNELGDVAKEVRFSFYGQLSVRAYERKLEKCIIISHTARYTRAFLQDVRISLISRQQEEGRRFDASRSRDDHGGVPRLGSDEASSVWGSPIYKSGILLGRSLLVQLKTGCIYPYSSVFWAEADDGFHLVRPSGAEVQDIQIDLSSDQVNRRTFAC